MLQAVVNFVFSPFLFFSSSIGVKVESKKLFCKLCTFVSDQNFITIVITIIVIPTLHHLEDASTVAALQQGQRALELQACVRMNE